MSIEADAPDGRYVGRFAPSPTGPLHAGSLVAALASWLDARAHGGKWLVRIEDVDTPRCVRGADGVILGQLADCGLRPDESPVWQSQRGTFYEAALQQLLDSGWAYPCGCSRKEIAQARTRLGMQRGRHDELVYPGTCRDGLHGKAARAWRALTTRRGAAPGAWEAIDIEWSDRRLGRSRQNLAESVGDFVLRRADGLWAYQLAVVVDDARQGITDIVRGEDLADNTPRQIHLQRLLGLPTPRYMHAPLVLGADGEKLSKQNGALAADTSRPLQALQAAAATLGLDLRAPTLPEALAAGVAQWQYSPERRK
jgi:glutamyl-Q tRNA(Asp) synthetase